MRGGYTLYLSKRGPGNALSRKNKADRSNSRKKGKNCHDINQIVVIYLGFAMNILIIFLQRELGQFSLPPPKSRVVCSLSSSCCVPPAASHNRPTDPHMSRECFVVASLHSLPFPPRIAFFAFTQQERRGPTFKDNADTTFVEEKIYLISRESLTARPKGG